MIFSQKAGSAKALKGAANGGRTEAAENTNGMVLQGLKQLRSQLGIDQLSPDDLHAMKSDGITVKEWIESNRNAFGK